MMCGICHVMYVCSYDSNPTAAIAFAPYVSFPIFELANSSAAQCVRDRICTDPSPDCDGAEVAVGLPSCTTNGRRAQAVGDGDSAGDRALTCYRDAFDFCKTKTAMNQCPGLGPKMLSKSFPTSMSLGKTEKDDLGMLVYSPSDLNRTQCVAGNCFQALLNLDPRTSSEDLAQFHLRSDLSTGTVCVT